jgi:hypothetical protein
MRSHRKLIVVAVVTAALLVPVCTTFAAPKPKAVVDAGVIAPSIDVFGEGTKYDNTYSRQARDMVATGSFTVNQAASAKYVVVQASLAGLLPSALYRVYFDRDGIVVGDLGTAGPCFFVGTITTDADGLADFYYDTGDLDVGEYHWALYLNLYNKTGGNRINHTVLVGDNMDFFIEP